MCIFLQVLWNFTCLPPGKLTYVDPENEQFVVETSLKSPSVAGSNCYNLLEADPFSIGFDMVHSSKTQPPASWLSRES